MTDLMEIMRKALAFLEGCDPLLRSGDQTNHELREEIRASLSQAGAGGGVVVTDEMVNAAWNEGKRRRVTGSTYDFRAVLEVALAALSASPSAGGRAGEQKLVEHAQALTDGFLRLGQDATPPAPVQTASVEVSEDWLWRTIRTAIIELGPIGGSERAAKEILASLTPAPTQGGGSLVSDLRGVAVELMNQASRDWDEQEHVILILRSLGHLAHRAADAIEGKTQ